MASPSKYRKNASSTKRILAEAKELSQDSSSAIHAAPLESDLFEWHFTIRLKHDEYAGGMYHGRILLPHDYPLKPPEIMLLTPNGRFETHKKICLSITGYHVETWSPSWGIRTALMGLIAFFSTEAKGAIGGLDVSADERKRLASASSEWSCPTCQVKNSELLPDEDAVDAGADKSISQKNFDDSAAAALQQLMSRSQAGKAMPGGDTALRTAADFSSNTQPSSNIENTGLTLETENSIPDRNAEHAPEPTNPTRRTERPQPPPAWLDKVIFALMIGVIALVFKRAGFTFGMFATASVRQPAQHGRNPTHTAGQAAQNAAQTQAREQPTYEPGATALSH